MSPARHRVALVGLTIAFAGVSTLAFAGLKNKAPDGVKLGGTEWQLDPYHSDDPERAIDRASREARQPSASSRSGGIFGDDDPLGRRVPDPTAGQPGYPPDRDRPGGWPSQPRGNPSDTDPIGNQTITMQFGARPHSIFFESLRKNPGKLGFAEGHQSMTVTADGVETECEAGTKAPFSDSYGDGERTCGWSGRAWVVETKRGQQFSRTDRYELSRDGKTLKYTTTAAEEGTGRVTIERRYQVPVPAASR